MRGNDTSDSHALRPLEDLRVATALLTRLPLPFPAYDPTRPPAAAAWAYPIVGAIVAGICSAVILLATGVGLSSGATAGLVLICAMTVTGAMHADGLADCADGFWGGWTRERRLDIMKDSQIGTYGVLALVLCLGLQWHALSILIAAHMLWPLFAAAMISRAAMVWMMAALPHARGEGLSHHTGRPDRRAVVVALVCAAPTLLFPGVPRLAALVCTLLVAAGIFALARNKIGGQTGDVLGATQQVNATSLLLVFSTSVDIA